MMPPHESVALVTAPDVRRRPTAGGERHPPAPRPGLRVGCVSQGSGFSGVARTGREGGSLVEPALAGRTAARDDTRLQEAQHAARQAEARAERLASLQRITAELFRAMSLDDVVDVALGTGRQELGAQSGSLCLVVGDELELTHAVGYPDEVMKYWRRFPLSAALPAGDAVRTGRPVFVRSPQELHDRYPAFASTPLVKDQAFTAIPLAEADPPGCLVFGFKEARDFTEEDKAFLFVLAARCGTALQRAQLFEDQRRAIAAQTAARQAAETSRGHLAFLAQASAILSSSLDYENTLNRVAELAVPRLADWCGIYLTGERGEILPVAVTHVDPERVRFVRQLLERFPPRASDPAGIAEIIRTGRPQIYPEISEEDLAASISGEQLELFKKVGLGAGMALPLQARGKMFGAFTLANDQGRPLGPDDQALAEDLAARAAIAIDNARLYRDRATVARVLQQSLMPPHLPDIPRVELAARFLPASHDIGGDFYDAFALANGNWLLAVGDVCGKGPAAAALTGLIRSALHGVATQASTPAAILGGVNEALLSQAQDQRLFTMVVAIFDGGQAAPTVTIGCAGHPLPVVVRASGAVEEVGCGGGTLLGVFADPLIPEIDLELRGGDAIVFFTDGVSDRAGDTSGLVKALGRAAGGAAALADCVVRHAEEENSYDDVAVLVLKVGV